MTAPPSLPHLQPTARTWQLLRACYPGQNPAEVLQRALDMLATADGHLAPNGRIKRGVGGRPERRTP